jgi:F420-dependent oxidoreductase-like protein
MQIGLMLEGQNGLTWPRWKRIIETADRAGFQCVFRSDHFTNARPPAKDALDLWASLTYAASHSRNIEFGPLVSPVTFRHPSVVVRMAAAVSELGGGRLVLGLGAGWQEHEHDTFGIPFPAQSVRYEMLEEYLEVVTRLLRDDGSVSFEGRHYRLHEATLLPRPAAGSLPVVIGGNGEKRTMPLAAKFADEWNAIFIPPDRFRELTGHMDSLLDGLGRARSDVRRSLMTGTLLARGDADLREKLSAQGRTLQDLHERGLIAGTPEHWIDRLKAYRDAGVQRIMLQWLDLDDTEGIAVVAERVLSHV